jgi:hypothetical protein
VTTKSKAVPSLRSKGKCLYKTNCNDCGSRDGKQVYLLEDGTNDAWCWACKTYDTMSSTHNVVPINKMKESKMDISQVNKLPTTAIKDRGLSLATVEKFGIKVALSEIDGKTITHHYYPDHLNGELIGYESRECATKSFTSVGQRKGDFDLWNQHNVTKGKKLFITEGRLDACSVYQAIIDNMPKKYSSQEPAVVSLTRGAAGAVKDIVANRTFVEGFNEVILCFDGDAAGKLATKEVLRTFPCLKLRH